MLYLVPTPIGNLRDITLRALDVLMEVNGVICEDTRHTGKLLKHFNIEQPMISFHDHSGPGARENIIDLLKQGKHLALVADAGTPLVSDPGFKIVRDAIKNGISVEALPGPSAFVTALVASGLPTDSFGFFGFLPQKSAGRRKELGALASREETLIFYESPHRILKCLTDIKEILGDREAAVCRELTKKFEEVVRGRISSIIDKFTQKPPKGEMVVLISGHGRKEVLA
ncbi:MAG: 16S rRNA (cytidine(1402)-2'-O)-methyltransferase [Candidatus Omnitrophota bacterium]|nr:16S rRNA (cytidine(1402)-2'-O)-methyltransferase [Candidatus Omnitrophota bacterium]